MVSDVDLDRIEESPRLATDVHVEQLVAEVRRLRDEVAGWREQAAINDERYQAWRRRWGEMHEIAGENKAEIDRLADAIQDHYRRMDSDREALGYGKHHPIDLDLWAALDQEDVSRNDDDAVPTFPVECGCGRVGPCRHCDQETDR